MAEAIGIASGIAQLLLLAAEITKVSYGYFRDVRKATQTQKSYLQEVSALTDVLFRLEYALCETEKLPQLNPRPASISRSTIAEWQKTLEAQKKRLEKHVSSFVWPFQDKDLRKAIDELHRMRNILSDFAIANTSSVLTHFLVHAYSCCQDYLFCYLPYRKYFATR